MVSRLAGLSCSRVSSAVCHACVLEVDDVQSGNPRDLVEGNVVIEHGTLEDAEVLTGLKEVR
jgi:hypothetical protein